MLEKLHLTKGIEKAFLLNELDRDMIVQFEKNDEQMLPSGFGKKKNIGIDQVLISNILICFLTNKKYDWPKNNLKIVHQGKIIGEDISDIATINSLKESKEHYICGNIVIYKNNFNQFQNSNVAPVMLIESKPYPEMKEISFVSEALIASPSRLTHKYLKSKIRFENENCVGSFLLGVNLENAQM